MNKNEQTAATLCAMMSANTHQPMTVPCDALGVALNGIAARIARASVWSCKDWSSPGSPYQDDAVHWAEAEARIIEGQITEKNFLDYGERW